MSQFRYKRIKKRTVRMTPEIVQGLKDQRAAFREKFGREPGPDDPVFFDPHADTPQPFSEATSIEVHGKIAAGMRAADIREEIVYAYEKTGLLVTTENAKHMSRADIEEWNAAIDEYRRTVQ